MKNGSSHAPSITVVGPGAVGSLLAVYLSRVGAQVSVLARSGTARTLATLGLTVRHETEVLHVKPRIIEHGLEAGVQDIVVLAVKSNQVESIAPHIEALVGPHTCVVTTMNGLPWWFADTLEPHRRSTASLQPPHDFSHQIAPRQIVGCLVYVNCSRNEPGVVRRNAGQRMIVGAVDPDGTAYAQCFGALLTEAKFDVLLSADIRLDLWDKLIGNAVLNPLTALTRCTIGDICDDLPARALAESAMSEIIQLGVALGFGCLASPADRLKALEPLRSCSTSMLQDVLAGRPTEIEAMLRPLLELGTASGVAMPAMSTLFTLARLLETKPGAPSPADEPCHAPAHLPVRPRREALTAFAPTPL